MTDDQPDTDHDEVMRRAAQVSIRWSRAMELLADAEREEQRQAEEAAEAHMDSPWPHRPAS